MKALRYILIIAAGLLIGLSNTALARSNVFVCIGSGHRGSHSGCRADYKQGSRKTSHRYRHHKSSWCRRNYRNRQRINISRSVYRYDRKLGYCIAIPPMIIEKQIVMVSPSSPQVVQPQQFDESTLQLNMSLQRRKSELLKQLQAPNKELRKQAIEELAGFSFDDNVRAALENILLSDTDPELRAEAARSFGAVKNAKARAALEKARVEDLNADVRRAADEAIKSITGN